MSPSRADRILAEWGAVSARARRPAASPRPVVVRSGLPASTLAGAGLIVVALLAAGVWLVRPDSDGVGGISSQSPLPTATAAAPSEPATVPPATPSTAPTIGPCSVRDLTARITRWEGAAGHRIADVELTNDGPSACELEATQKPRLVDGSGAVLIDGSTPTSSAFLSIAPGDVVTTLVQDGNYCGPEPKPPVYVEFEFSDGNRLAATPVSPTDMTVPPCLSQPGSAGTIEMQPWTRP